MGYFFLLSGAAHISKHVPSLNLSISANFQHDTNNKTQKRIRNVSKYPS